jgi:hypothetical protein
MIGLAQVDVEHLLSAGFLASGRGLRRDKYDINPLQELRAIYLQYPTPWCFGIRVQTAQTSRRVLS